MSPKVKSLLAHVTPIGWIIALVINNNNKDEYTSFYLRQTLGLYIVGTLLNLIRVFGWILGIVVIVFWILSFVYVIQEEKKVVPFGEYFQKWFKGI